MKNHKINNQQERVRFNIGQSSETIRQNPHYCGIRYGPLPKEAKSEIPCGVSSRLHEWHNGLKTVLKRDSVKLQCQ